MAQVLSTLKSSIPRGAIGFDSSEDAAVYPMSDNQLLLQTVDFFTPIVDDPFTFGQIAAVNSLSDIYAMGGEPLFALNVVGFPSDDLPVSVLSDILRGGEDIASKAGISILGGHTIKDKEPKYGMVITGVVDKKNLTRNDSALSGDLLILTKPLGSGIITTAIKQDLADEQMIESVQSVMKTLNKTASTVMSEVGVNACTDVTGYGLLGHLLELCKSSRVTAEISFDSIPFLEGVFEFAQKGIVPGGTKRNLEFVSPNVEFDSTLADYQKLMLADAQTSGGLLIAVSEDKVQTLINKLSESKVMTTSIIGRITNKTNCYIKVS